MKPNPPVTPPPERPIKSPGTTLTTVAIALSGLGLVLVFGGVLTWFSGFFAECDNDNERPVPSPDGKWTAVLFRRDCGDASKYTTHVSILGIHEKLPNEPGNVFTAIGEAAVILRWQDDRNLVIEAADGTNVTFRATKFEGFQISDH